MDQDAINMNFAITTAFESAGNAGFQEGSDEFGIVVTNFLVKANENFKEISKTHNMNMISLAVINILESKNFNKAEVNITFENSSGIVNITNDILESPRSGSALKLDKYHAFSDIVHNYAGMATKTSINNGTLYQLEGTLNGVHGRFEWIIDSTGKYAGQVSHRFFVAGGKINGVPIKP